jgi:hypothetical protein
MSWKRKLEQALLSGMKYCFPNCFSSVFGREPEKLNEWIASHTAGELVQKLREYPELYEEAFYGTPGDANNVGGESGFLDFMEAVVSDMRKEMFFLGYKHGGRDAVIDICLLHPDLEIEFCDEHSEAGAWDRWGEVDE